MRFKIVLFVLACFIVILPMGCTKRTDWPVLKGPYLGQKHPGMVPEIFAPGVISTDSLGEGGCAFTRDAKLFLFNRRHPLEEHSAIYMTELRDGIWTEPSPAPFNSEYQDWEYHFAPDGKTLYFTSKRPVKEGGEPSQYGHIWKTQMATAGWTPPDKLGYPVNTADSHSIYASVANGGTLYFFSRRDGGFGESDIYRTRLVDGEYAEVENLGEAINTEYDLFVAPDESYLIFSSDRPGGYGEYNDIYVIFRNNDDTWTEPVNLGREFRDSGVSCVTLDGKFLFFSTGRTGKDDIYWVDAKIIDEMKPVIDVRALSPNLYRFSRGVNNWIVLVGSDGVLLSDYAPEIFAEAMKSELRKLGSDNVQFIINTHWHHDHTGGNLLFGGDAIIIAHHSVRNHHEWENWGKHVTCDMWIETIYCCLTNSATQGGKQ